MAAWKERPRVPAGSSRGGEFTGKGGGGSKASGISFGLDGKPSKQVTASHVQRAANHARAANNAAYSGKIPKSTADAAQRHYTKVAQAHAAGKSTSPGTSRTGVSSHPKAQYSPPKGPRQVSQSEYHTLGGHKSSSNYTTGSAAAGNLRHWTHRP